MNSQKYIFVALLSLALLASATAQTDVRQIAERVDRHYNSLKTLQADFTEIYRGPGISRTESGTLWLKKPGRMRWEYRTPREKLFLTDGRTAWFYVPGENQARHTPLKSLDDLRSPLAYMLGKTKLQKEFVGLSPAPDISPLQAGNVVLRGVPKNMGDTMTDVVMEITPSGQFVRLIANQVDGSSTEFRFANQKENVPLTDSRFKFTPPRGVESIEANDLGQ